jgi:hypothetical protein
LYNLIDDPLQQVNLWHDTAYRATRDDLLDDMWRHIPERIGERRPCDAPV